MPWGLVASQEEEVQSSTQVAELPRRQGEGWTLNFCPDEKVRICMGPLEFSTIIVRLERRRNKIGISVVSYSCALGH